jgi:AcrR family transcriptional regulator
VCQDGGVSAVVRPYRGVSAETRRAERRARLKQACLDLIEETGVAAISAEAVCARAGLTKRYFYENFADRDALLYEVMDEFFIDVGAEMLAALATGEATPAQRAQTVARVLIEFLERDRRLARLYIESAGQPTLRARRERAYEAFTRLLLDTVADAQESDTVEDGVRTADPRAFATLIVVAGTTQAAISWLQGDVELPRDSVIEQIARMIIGALEI